MTRSSSVLPLSSPSSKLIGKGVVLLWRPFLDIRVAADSVAYFGCGGRSGGEAWQLDVYQFLRETALQFIFRPPPTPGQLVVVVIPYCCAVHIHKLVAILTRACVFVRRMVESRNVYVQERDVPLFGPNLKV